MIAYLEGLLAETWGTSCIVVTRGGVGYELDLPAHTMASLPGRGESVALSSSCSALPPSRNGRSSRCC